MRAAFVLPSNLPIGRRALLATLIVLACSWSVEGSSWKPSEAFDAASHAEACKCGAKCKGASCCCGSRASKPKPSVASKTQADVSENPCLNSAPCRDPLLPPSMPVGSHEKVAAIASIEPVTVPTGLRRFLATSSRILSDRRASRLDRPPRALASA